MKTVDQILSEAADLIDAAPMLAKKMFVTWRDADGNYDEDNGVRCFCTIGAIDWLSVGDFWHPHNDEAIEYLADHIGLPVSNYSGAESAVYHWNDADERTKDEVVTTLRGAAAQYRQENVNA